jgi:hypothetical protein
MSFDGTYKNEQPITANASTLDTITQVVDGATTYVGRAPVASLPSTSTWLIYKQTTAGDTVSIQYASAEFDQEWDERAALHYGPPA